MKISEIKEKLKTNPVKTFSITKHITVKTSKYKLLTAGALTVLLVVFVSGNAATFLNAAIPQNVMLYNLCILASLATGALIGFEYTLPAKLEKWLMRLMIVLIPIGTMAMAECLNGVYIGNWTPLATIYNVIFYALLYMAVFAATGKRKIPFLVINPIIYILALTNHYVMAFRGTPFLPVDILYIKTAAAVAENYTFTLNYQVIIATIMFLLMLAAASKIKTGPQKLWKKIYYRSFCAFFALAVLGGYLTTNFFVDAGVTNAIIFEPDRGYNKYGVSLSFFANIKFLTVEEPYGYDANKIESIVYEAIDTETANKTPKENTVERPNIICIMNETLSDLSVLGDFKTNKDYMPFLHTLKENTVRGNLYVSVIGGGTSNTEFEFLTGATTAFLPTGSNAFGLYINNDLNNLTTTLKSYGYSADAFHPHYKNNWNRANVYNYLGFDSFIALEEITEQLVEDYETAFIRKFVSDAYNYETVIEMYEEREEETPFYLFNVTIQNHGGYSGKYGEFEEEIYLVDESGNPVTDYPEVNKYLSLIYESDKAAEELINYFSKQNEPMVICIFGDHQPSLKDEYIAKLLGAENINSLTPEQNQARYCTPFYIWANYDIEEREIERLSANYLSSYLMKSIGMEMPAFNQYLLKLSETLPVINASGYIDTEGNHYTYDEPTEYSELIAKYKQICYNFLFDEEHRCNELYRLAP